MLSTQKRQSSLGHWDHIIQEYPTSMLTFLLQSNAYSTAHHTGTVCSARAYDAVQINRSRALLFSEHVYLVANHGKWWADVRAKLELWAMQMSTRAHNFHKWSSLTYSNSVNYQHQAHMHCSAMIIFVISGEIMQVSDFRRIRGWAILNQSQFLRLNILAKYTTGNNYRLYWNTIPNQCYSIACLQVAEEAPEIANLFVNYFWVDGIGSSLEMWWFYVWSYKKMWPAR